MFRQEIECDMHSAHTTKTIYIPTDIIFMGFFAADLKLSLADK